MPTKICVVGSANVDLTFRTSRLPLPGETLAGQVFHLGFGGKGANQAVIAARLGAAVTLVARLGDDAFGRESLHHLQAEGLDVSHVGFDAGRSTGVAGIIVDDEARNCILVVPGANFGLTAEDVRAARSALEAAVVVLCQMEVPLEATLAAFRLARAARVLTILNPAPAMGLPPELIRLTDLCVLNETELETLTDLPAGTLEQVEAGARTLQRSGVRAVIVTLGARGTARGRFDPPSRSGFGRSGAGSHRGR